MHRSLLSLTALAGLVALSGCAGLGNYGNNDYYGNDRYGNDRYEDGRYGNDRYNNRGRSAFHRRVERDARRYVNDLDRYLRISNREERAIRDLLIDRTYRLLDQTNVRRHRDVYPFPRRGRAQRWWAQTDRQVERILDRRFHEPYGYYNRYGGQRYNEYYRHRRYDNRRGWYDTRRARNDGYRQGRQDERARDRRRDRRDAARRADRQQDRRRAERQEERRRAERREDRRRTERQQERRRAERQQDRRQDRRRA
ncbi:MAG: hypothetical protein WBA11_07360, partial [Rubrivirga sp.]